MISAQATVLSTSYLRRTAPPSVRNKVLRYVCISAPWLHLLTVSPIAYNIELPKLRRTLRYLATIAITLGEPPENILVEEFLAMELPLNP